MGEDDLLESLRDITDRYETRARVLANQDDCLIAITDGKPVPTRKLRALPPWRAVLIARVAAKAGIPLEHGTLDALIAEAQEVGGDGSLRPAPEEART